MDNHRSDGDNGVIDGHLRLRAAQRLGMTELPVTLADDMTEAQIKAFRLLANRSVVPCWRKVGINELLSRRTEGFAVI